MAAEQTLRSLGLGFGANNPDLIYLEGDAGSIGVEEIRNLESQLVTQPLQSPIKAAVVTRAEKMTEEAQNAFLKTLEEPPEKAAIILLSPNTDTLLSTVVSRCLVSDLGDISDFTIEPKEKPALEKVLGWIGEGSLKNGFAWSEENSKERPAAINLVDKLLVLAGQAGLKDPCAVRKLFRAKMYLQANTNVRLTLENLFVKV